MPEPGDDGTDIQSFAGFMRSTKAPSRGPVTQDVMQGGIIFRQVGCSICHTPDITTAPPGTQINGGTFTVPDALGNKIIHPYSDFLLHNVGTGDGIPVQPTPELAYTADQMRTAPLWGLRTRNRLMHDAVPYSPLEAIRRHAGQAAEAVSNFNAMPEAKQKKLLAFLASL